MRYSQLFLLAVMLLMPVRFTAATAAGAQRDVLAGTEWRLTSFGEAGAQSPLIEGTVVTIKFSADGKVNGSGGCNSYGGEYRVHDENISLGRLISTKRACSAQAVTEQEQRYFKALESAGKFKLAGEQLTILYGEGRGSLHFVKTSPPGSSAQQQEGAGASDAETEKEIVRIIQSLMDAVAVGDKAVWEKHVADDLIYTVEGGRLTGQRAGRDKQELLPADVHTYFVKGTLRGEKVFVRGAGGRVTAMLDRRENNDLVWKRIK